MQMTQYQQLTPEDQYIMDLFHCQSGGSFNREAYELHIADRNDYAVMLARTVIASVGCRATRSRCMPA
jgi:hypothetical protein